MRFNVEGANQETDNSKEFLAKVFRYDLFRLPLLPEPGNVREYQQNADHEVLVVDSTFDGMKLNAKTAVEAAELAREKIYRQLLPTHTA